MNRLRWILLAGGWAGLAAAVVLIATVKGAGLTPDSAAYLASGYHLAAGAGLRMYTGQVLTVFPPGLPIIAWFGEWIGIGGEGMVRVSNALSFAGAVFLGLVLLRRHVRSERVVVLCVLVLSVGLPLLSVASMVYSEPVFVVACLAFILVLERSDAHDSAYPSWLAAAVLVWVGTLFRYAGLALIPAGALTLLLLRKRARGWRAAVVASAAFSAVAAAAPIAWMLRNRGVDGTLMGPRGPSTLGLEDVVVGYVATVGRWILPHPTPWQVQQLAGAVLLLGLFGWAFVSMVRTHEAREPPPSLERRGSLLPISCFIAVYSLYLVAAELTTRLDPIDGRLLSPVYVPLLVLAARAAEETWTRVPHRARARLQPVVVVLLALFVLGQGFASTRWMRWSAWPGIGFASAEWQSSGLVAASKELPPRARLFSNFPDAVWAVSPGRQVQWIPREPGLPPLTGDPLPTLADFLRAAACNEAYLIWFDEARPGLRSLADLGVHAELTTVSRQTDGVIYSIRSTPSEGAAAGGLPGIDTGGVPACPTPGGP